jgi:hypothetical protein
MSLIECVVKCESCPVCKSCGAPEYMYNTDCWCCVECVKMTKEYTTEEMDEMVSEIMTALEGKTFKKPIEKIQRTVYLDVRSMRDGKIPKKQIVDMVVDMMCAWYEGK